MRDSISATDSADRMLASHGPLCLPYASEEVELLRVTLLNLPAPTPNPGYNGREMHTLLCNPFVFLVRHVLNPQSRNGLL